MRLLLAALLVLVVACTKDEPTADAVHTTSAVEAPKAAAQGALGSAQAQLNPLGTSTVSGSISLRQEQDGVRVEGEVRGLPPKGVHGFHIHENGDCSSPDGSSAGPHFNPHGAEHGGPADAQSHLGDLGNLESDSEGVARVSMLKKGITLSPGTNGVVGRAVIVHQAADDLKSQPTGNAGGRIACGVINLVM